jgi:hypothetical protein
MLFLATGSALIRGFEIISELPNTHVKNVLQIVWGGTIDTRLDKQRKHLRISMVFI